MPADAPTPIPLLGEIALLLPVEGDERVAEVVKAVVDVCSHAACDLVTGLLCLGNHRNQALTSVGLVYIIARAYRCCPVPYICLETSELGPDAAMYVRVTIAVPFVAY